MNGAPTDPYGYCEAMVRQEDRDAWLASLFAPAALRPYLHALDAFRLEIEHVKGRVTQPLAGEIRLQWWRDVLAGQARGDALANPIAAALIDTIDRKALPRDILDDAIEAHRIALYDEPVPTVEALEQHFTATLGGFVRLAAAALAGSPGDVATPARHAGIAWGLNRLLLTFSAEAAQGAPPVPAEILRRHGAGQDNMTSEAATLTIKASLADLRSLARTHLSSLRQVRSVVPEAAAPAYLRVALVEPSLRLLDCASSDPFAPPPVLPPWRRQWILWRASRRDRVP